MDENKKKLAEQARLIAREMRWKAENPLNEHSTASPGDTFIPFVSWYEEVAKALET